jgi:hypothetical protein
MPNRFLLALGELTLSNIFKQPQKHPSKGNLLVLHKQLKNISKAQSDNTKHPLAAWGILKQLQ